MGKFITLLKLLPKVHQILIIVLVFITVVIVLLPYDDAQASKNTNTRLSGRINMAEHVAPNTADIIREHSEQLKIPLAFRTPTPPTNHNASPNNASSERAITSSSAQTDAQAPLATSAQNTYLVHIKIKPGDNLAALFERAGLSARDVYEVARLPKAKQTLLKIMPGKELVIAKNSQDEFVSLSYPLDPISTLIIEKDATGYQERITKKHIERRTKFASATIKSNFWNDGIGAGLSPNQIMQLATIFGWDIDFALDLRKDDQFAIIYDDEYADGEFVRDGNILAAEFTNQGERFTAVRYTDGIYYSAEGRSMRKAFLRSPVDFKYVSSSFNPRRLHPVTGQVRAHRGVDYVAAVGTPIKAAGEGRVIKSAYNQYNGNYVFIKHNDTYTTKYLHMKQRKVKQGSYVKQGQIIGTLGATGRVTGAHLHYEFIVNGSHRNPRTVKLPKSLPIARAEKTKFLALSQQIMTKLQHDQQVELAAQ